MTADPWEQKYQLKSIGTHSNTANMASASNYTFRYAQHDLQQSQIAQTTSHNHASSQVSIKSTDQECTDVVSHPYPPETHPA